MKHSPFLLCVLDGVGLNPSTKGNAVAAARTPTLDRLFETCPNTTLTTFGPAVGLPEGQMGNSEVGHLNIGAGRVVKQWLLRIGDAFREHSVEDSDVFNQWCSYKPGQKIHLLGLCSFGGVHSHLEHLFGLLELLNKKLPQSRIALHLVTDGRDVAPNQFIKDLARIEEECKKYGESVSIGSLAGRYYTMDRDKRWERTEAGYKALLGVGESHVEIGDNPFQTIRELVQKNYTDGVTDEFHPPVFFGSHQFSQEDKLVCWNFRSDRMRQIVRALTSSDFTEFKRAVSPLDSKSVLCFAQYDQEFQLPVLFPTEIIQEHLGEVLAKENYTQLRIAETEKYPHVTYFLNGGDEVASPGEERSLVPSPRDVKTYDEKPEMSAHEVTQVVLDALSEGKFDFYVLNFANGDMVGHTGVFDAAVKAVETVDECLGKILEALKDKDGAALILADHGNAEQMINEETGGPHTAHTTYPVPAILFGIDNEQVKLRDGGALCDVAPTVLKVIDVPQPPVMTGQSLIISAS